nr:unnamed protein product [Digitaria exilis]
MSNAFSVASAAPRLCPVTVMLSSSSLYVSTSLLTSLNACIYRSIVYAGWTMASQPSRSPSRPLGATMAKSRSSAHSMARTVPRQATTTSRRPSAAFPSSESVRHGHGRRGVEEPGDPVRGGVARQPYTVEEARPGEPAQPRVRRDGLVVEGVVGRLRHLAVAEDGAAQVEVERVKEAVPAALAVELAPPPGRVTEAAVLRHDCNN